MIDQEIINRQPSLCIFFSKIRLDDMIGEKDGR
jgi:hypothetical protein